MQKEQKQNLFAFSPCLEEAKKYLFGTIPNVWYQRSFNNDGIFTVETVQSLVDKLVHYQPIELS